MAAPPPAIGGGGGGAFPLPNIGGGGGGGGALSLSSILSLLSLLLRWLFLGLSPTAGLLQGRTWRWRRFAALCLMMTVGTINLGQERERREQLLFERRMIERNRSLEREIYIYI